MEGRTRELKADDKMTDDLCPDGLHIFTSQSHNTVMILHISTRLRGRSKRLYLPLKARLVQQDPPGSHSYISSPLAAVNLSRGLLGSAPFAPLSSEADQFGFPAEAIGGRRKKKKKP